MKPGWKTTEFWLSLVAVLVGAVVASGVVPETGPWSQVIGIVSTVLGALGYSVTRGFAKTAAANAIGAAMVASAGEAQPANPTPPKP